eukprot:TRINITY_DN12587_c0_g1_i1.p1 TRINITY_DN12587_c0_g1~~TRINITY_DN12587_c0_g1_i1.p1  ORF type:complete len:454 (-),score=105.34 TRINITY_DN12587_c0_g1_i1:18-1379(-)
MTGDSSSDTNQKDLKSVVIIGAGIGGLALAHLLAGSGTKVSVYEKDESPESRQQGYWIGIQPLGLNVLKRLFEKVPGLSDQVSVSSDLKYFHLADDKLKLLASFGGEEESGYANRWGLRKALSSGIEVHWGKKLSSVQEVTADKEKSEGLSDRVVATFSDGTKVEADFLVGADGSFSAVRAYRCPDLTAEDTGVVGITGRMDLAEEHRYPKSLELLETGFLRVFGENGHSMLLFKFRPENQSHEEICWCLSWPLEGNQLDMSSHKGIEKSDTDDDQLTEEVGSMREMALSKMSAHFGDPETAYIVQNSAKISDKMYPYFSAKPRQDNPLDSVKSSRVTLLGDALHPMTTHRGMGANTALADAGDLAEALQQTDWRASVGRYNSIAFERGFDHVKGSLESTRMIHKLGSRNATLWFLWVIGWLFSVARLASSLPLVPSLHGLVVRLFASLSAKK